MLCYHRIGGPLELGVTRVSRRVFERQMRALARAGWRTLTLDGFLERWGDPGPASERDLLLTFDDGYASLAEQVYPLLAELGFTATTFLISDFVGRTNTWDMRYTWRRLPHLDWGAIERWAGRGFDFGSHTACHARLTWLDDGRVAEELGRSRERLVGRLGGVAGRAVAYPFGACDARVERLARGAGYLLGCAGVRGSGTRFGVRRVPVYLWDRSRLPLGVRRDGLGAVGRWVAHAANRCAVGTSWMQQVTAALRSGR